MGIVFQDQEQMKRAQELAARRGLSVDEAVSLALTEALERTASNRPPNKKASLAELKAIAQEYHALPVFDARSPDEILGYNEHGGFD